MRWIEVSGVRAVIISCRTSPVIGWFHERLRMKLRAPESANKSLSKGLSWDEVR